MQTIEICNENKKQTVKLINNKEMKITNKPIKITFMCIYMYKYVYTVLVSYEGCGDIRV